MGKLRIATAERLEHPGERDDGVARRVRSAEPVLATVSATIYRPGRLHGMGDGRLACCCKVNGRRLDPAGKICFQRAFCPAPHDWSGRFRLHEVCQPLADGHGRQMVSPFVDHGHALPIVPNQDSKMGSVVQDGVRDADDIWVLRVLHVSLSLWGFHLNQAAR